MFAKSIPSHDRTRIMVPMAIKSPQIFLASLLDEIPFATTVFDSDWHHVYSNRIGSLNLDTLAVFDQHGALTRFGSLHTKEMEQAALGTPIKLLVDGPPVQILEITVRTLRIDDTLEHHLLLVKDITEEQSQYVKAQEQDRLAAMGQLAAGIAHDFNNMLTPMIGYADILASSPDTPEDHKEKLAVISNQGKRAEQLVRQVLDFSRQRTTRRTPIDIFSLVTEVASLLKQTVPESVTIALEPNEQKLIAMANATQIHETVTNLVVNARDAMPSGGTITLSTKLVEIPDGDRLVTYDSDGHEVPPEGGNWIAIVVRDSGSGMPPDVIRRVFEPFYTTKTESKGTGLGLAQVYGIVRQHDGFIGLQSAIGVGTTFVIYLPQSDETDGAPPRLESELTRGNGEKVLIVEDDRIVLDAIAAMAEDVGYTVATASDGREALELLEQGGDIQIILTDVVMPGIGGVELARKVAQDYPAIPLIMMTGHTLDERDAIEQRSAAFLSKPLSLPELATALNYATPKPE